MPALRTLNTKTEVLNGSAAQRAAGPLTDLIDESTDDGCVRLLVLDEYERKRTIEQIENALWVWPHKISTAETVADAVRMCQQAMPSAAIVSLVNPFSHSFNAISALRKRIPAITIIAVISTNEISSPAAILDLGADAIVPRDELDRPTLHQLLMRLRNIRRAETVCDVPSPVGISLPWRDSEIVGSLICDVEGAIISTNDCLARWLEYSSPSELLGKCVWRDILQSRSDWSSWKTVAGDFEAVSHQSIAVKASSGQLLWMDVQVFADPVFPNSIQAVLVDQTELAHLTGKLRHLG